MIERIAKLLNKAENAGTPQEAHIYFEKAQNLATAHSISLAKARLISTASTPAAPINRTIRIGEPRRHANRHLVRLFAVVGAINGLQVDVARNSTYVIAYGFEDDLDTAEVLWGRIATQMIRFGEQFLATEAWRGDQRIVRRRGRHLAAPMTRQTARSSYYFSFVDTIHDRLVEARDRAVRDAETAERRTGAARETGAAVALRHRADEVTAFYRYQSEARGSWNGHRSSVVGRPGSATAAGARDARSVPLGSHTEVGDKRGALSR